MEVKRRVKVFSFGESNVWEDMGTGYVTKDYIEVTRGEVLTITVRSEADGSIIVHSKVEPDRSYKMQEGTMILWTETESCDLALSFQDSAACDELWMKICEVQGFLSDDGDVSDRFEDSWSHPGLPPCELSKLEEILTLINSVTPFPQRRDGLALVLEREGYINKLLDLFHICEDLENLDGLHHLYEIFKSLFMFNSASLLQIMFQDDVMMDVIGCLEYNPNKATPTRHREYLEKRSQFREVIPFSSSTLLHKIHQTYKVQYIQEVILPTPSLFEENMMYALNSFILFNKAEIVNALQADVSFLKQLFDGLCAESTAEEDYQQLVFLLKEICVFSQALENTDRTTLFVKLNGFGFMTAVEGMLMSEDVVVVSSAVDMLNQIAEFNSTLLRDHAISTKDSTNEDTQFMNIIISLLVDGEFTDIDVQLVNLVKSLLNQAASGEGAAAQPIAEKATFLNYFYDHCMPRLMAPLMAQTSSDRISKDTPQNAVILSHILDILSLCVRIHTYHIQNYIIDKNVLSRVLVLMMSTHGHLVLSALRLCRRIIGLKNEFYNRYVIYKNLLNPIVKAFMANGHRYNLVNSAILELFDFIAMENKFLLSYVVENFWSTLETVDYVDTFKKLKLKHEQEQDAKNFVSSSVGNVVVQTRYRRDPRQMDEDEEAWFDEEEEEFISLKSFSTTPTSTPVVNLSPKTTPLSPKAASLLSKDPSPKVAPLSPKDMPPSIKSTSVPSITPQFVSTTMTSSSGTTTTSSGSRIPPGSYSPRPPASMGSKLQQIVAESKTMPTVSAALKSLVDYDEDSDEEISNSDHAEQEDGDSLNPVKRQRLS